MYSDHNVGVGKILAEITHQLPGDSTIPKGWVQHVYRPIEHIVEIIESDTEGTNWNDPLLSRFEFQEIPGRQVSPPQSFHSEGIVTLKYNLDHED